MQEMINTLQKMMLNNETTLKEAKLSDGDAIVEVFYDMIRVNWNGGSGQSSSSNYAEALEDASNASWKKIQTES